MSIPPGATLSKFSAFLVQYPTPMRLSKIVGYALMLDITAALLRRPRPPQLVDDEGYHGPLLRRRVNLLPLPIPLVPAQDIGTVFLDWSDDRGKSFGSPVGQSLGAIGAYKTNLQWQRLGMARDRVFRLTWSANSPTALQGAEINADVADS